MGPADQYRARAAEFLFRARREADLMIRAEWEQLAKGYLHLAEQADRNSLTDLVYESPQRRADTSPQQQQQQQQQPQPQEPDKQT